MSIKEYKLIMKPLLEVVKSHRYNGKDIKHHLRDNILERGVEHQLNKLAEEVHEFLASSYKVLNGYDTLDEKYMELGDIAIVLSQFDLIADSNVVAETKAYSSIDKIMSITDIKLEKAVCDIMKSEKGFSYYINEKLDKFIKVYRS